MRWFDVHTRFRVDTVVHGPLRVMWWSDDADVRVEAPCGISRKFQQGVNVPWKGFRRRPISCMFCLTGVTLY